MSKQFGMKVYWKHCWTHFVWMACDINNKCMFWLPVRFEKQLSFDFRIRGAIHLPHTSPISRSHRQSHCGTLMSTSRWLLCTFTCARCMCFAHERGCSTLFMTHFDGKSVTGPCLQIKLHVAQMFDNFFSLFIISVLIIIIKRQFLKLMIILIGWKF